MDVLHRTADEDRAPDDAVSRAIDTRIAAVELRIGRVHEALRRCDTAGIPPDREAMLAAAAQAAPGVALTLLARIGADPAHFLALGDRAGRCGNPVIAVEAYARAGAVDQVATVAYAALAAGDSWGLRVLAAHGCPIDPAAVLAFLDRTSAHAPLGDVIAAYALLGTPLPAARLRVFLTRPSCYGVWRPNDLRLLHERLGALPPRERILAVVPRLPFEEQVDVLGFLGASAELERLGRSYCQTREYAHAIRCFATGGRVDALRGLAAELWSRRREAPHVLRHILAALAASGDVTQLEAHAAILVAEGDIDGARQFFASAMRAAGALPTT